MGGKRPRRKFSDEFKRDAVEIVRSSGKPVRQVANELGIYDSTLGNWVRQDGINRGEREGLSTDERERLRELERENARLRMERELEKTSCGLLGAGVERVMLYRFVDAQRAEGFPVRMVCSVVGVSPSAYYAYRHRPRSGPAQLAEAALVDEIGAIWAESGGTYGSPRVCAELRRRGRVVNHKRVERLMKGHRMAGFVPRKRRVTTTADTAHRIPDLLAGDFGATRPDEAWVGDITYIRTRQGFLYLAFVLDLASRRVVGVSMASHMKASLVADALREAIGTRGGQVRGVVFHTDRGSQGGFNIRRGPPLSCAGHMASHSRWDGPGCAGTTQPPSRSSAPSTKNSSTEPTTAPATRPAYRSAGGSKPGTTHVGSIPRSANSHQTNGRTTTTITRPHKPSVQHTGGTPHRPPVGTGYNPGGRSHPYPTRC